MNLPRPSVAVRWLLAGLVGGYGASVLVRLMGGDSSEMPAAAQLFLGLTAIISGGLIISPEAVGWLVLPLHRLLDSIFLPGESAPPPVDFNLARFYGNQLRYEEACQEYAKIIRYHPEQTAAYLEGIQVAAHASDEALAGKFYRSARRVLRSEAQRSLLENVYAARHALLPAAGSVEAAQELDASGSLQPTAKALSDPSLSVQTAAPGPLPGLGAEGEHLPLE